MKKLMILNGSLFQVPLIKAAKEEGYYTILCDWTTTNPGIKLADKHYQISVLDFDAVLEISQKEQIDGIISNSEYAMPVVAKISEVLHLRGNPESAVKQFQSKYKFRKVLHMLGLFSPEAVESGEAGEFCLKVQNLVFPIIIKPSSCSASRGVTICESYNERQIKEIFAVCQNLSQDRKVTAENYIEARDNSFFEGEVFVLDGKVYDFGMFTCLRSKDFPLFPQCNVYPPILSREEAASIKEQLDAICRKVNFKFGIINVEGFIVKNGAPFFVEINARQGGGDNSLLINYCCDVDMHKLLVTTAMNDMYYYKQIADKKFLNPYITTLAVYSHKDGIYRGLHVDGDVKEYLFDMDELYTVGKHIDRTRISGDSVARVRLKFPNREIQLDYAGTLENKIYAKVE